ncbi:benzoate 1,2-dioxygenase large subunit [Pseudomonas aeruginosa]|nr:benzoate 1,2-dioxygenase large subunit [Pseudomonas aeruginosa]MCO3909423.1 benzoate 1,2-dioxygenase large subunit [Pseudomonas aeruginosa]
MSLGSDYLRSLLEEDPERGVYRCKREMFTDPRLFELEMKHIFEGNWVYLAHESQVAGVNDYLTTQIGRQSIVIARNRDGQLNAFINACSHRGAMLCRHKSGNRSSYTCPFHGWTFNNSGKLLKVKDPAEAGYPQGFNCEGSHDLTRVARFESYRGFLFGSLNPDVRPLAEHLGESAKIIDMIVDQSPEGLEVLRGSSSYVYEGNWKLTAENGADGYHVSSVHWNYAATQSQRQQRDAADPLRTMSAAGWARQGGGFYSFEHGHMLLWSRWANPEDRPAFERRAELARDFGEARADWMIENSRNLCLYPNVYLMDQFSSQIRIARPLSVDRTEITIYCIAPKGESAEARARRIRQYEDFFNVSGMATPDDLEEFRSCQQGYQGSVGGWNDLSRGAEHWIEGADAAAAAIDLRPRLSGVRTEDEGLFVLQHRYWQEALLAALERERTQRVALREVAS